ncbi:MAG: amidohydrolase, partial [Archangium sp.]|nr:amidohydrolase [Archangium sp.]
MASTVVIAQRVYTLDPARPTATAFVVRAGSITFVGTEADALALAGTEATVLRYPSSTVIPGLIDAHVHLASLGRALTVADLGTAKSETDAVERLTAATKDAYEGEWLRARGWDQNDWAGAVFPSKASLDVRFPTTPVYATRVDGHAAWVNTEALRRAGITNDTVDPPGGKIGRDATGEPTGLLIDNAMTLVEAKLPPPSDEVAETRLRRAVETCLSLGLTQVHDAGMDLATVRRLQRWDAEGRLPLRVYVMADGQGPDADAFLKQGPVTGRHLELRAVKLLADGALGSRGAALAAPYSDTPGETGLLLLSGNELASRARAFADQGFQVAVHAIGDRANSLVLDVLSSLPAGRHRVEHAQVLSPVDIPRFAKHGLIASFQPTHATSDMPWAEQRLGPERIDGAYAWRSVLDTGAHVAFGSDFPV